jgi:arsenate reductase
VTRARVTRAKAPGVDFAGASFYKKRSGEKHQPRAQYGNGWSDMNIQIYGKSKCFDTKKAERYFKERGVKFQSIDLPRYGMSRGELDSVRRAVGGLKPLIDEKSKDYDRSYVAYLASEEAVIEKLLELPSVLKTPIVRNGRQATVGYCPEIWKTWE